MNATQKPTLLLIDGHSLAFRAFYALSPDSFKTPDGQHTNAVHGFISMLLNILAAEKPTHLAVAFDLSRSSFRTDEYPEYKLSLIHI
jgi:DNA polymerase-1